MMDTSLQWTCNRARGLDTGPGGRTHREESPCRSEPSRLLELQLVGLREQGSSALSLLLRASLWRWVGQLCSSALKPPHRVWLQSQRRLNKCVMCDGCCFSHSTSFFLRNQGNLSNSLDQPLILKIISLFFSHFQETQNEAPGPPEGESQSEELRR